METFDQQKFSDILQTSSIGREFFYLSETGSTNDQLRTLCAHREIPEGTLLLTDHQKAGRGRSGRRWYSGPGVNLTFSLLLKPRISFNEFGLISLMSGVAVVRGITSCTSQGAGLKWPNDIIMSGRKIGGILTKRFTTDGQEMVIVGIGLNVNETLAELPKSLQANSLSLVTALGSQLPREALLADILLNFEQLYHELSPDVVEVWESYCVHVGKAVKFHYGSQESNGRFEGLAPNGYARIRIGDRTRIVSSGEIELNDLNH